MKPDSNMNLAIFDIDGTLTRTDHVDDICFVQALADVHAITDVGTDWAAYPHTTDSAITSYIFQERFNRTPEEAELQNFKSHFVRLLEGYCTQDPSLFSEIVGASSMLRRVNQEPEWRTAIATGGCLIAWSKQTFRKQKSKADAFSNHTRCHMSRSY